MQARDYGRVRDYAGIAERVASEVGGLPDLSRRRRMQIVVDALWDGLHKAGVSWVGFYEADPEAPEGQRMVLGPCRDKPACSPIGLKGVCGSAYTSGHVQIVRDVRELGANYIACDPKDRSELVIPLFEPHMSAPPGSPSGAGRCWGVLDADSWEVGAFNDGDAAGMTDVLEAAQFLAA